MRARQAFYGWRSIAGRALRGAPMWRDPYKIGTMLLANWISRREIVRKQGRPLAIRRPAELAEAHAVKVTLIKPTIGRMTHSLYVDEARMEPLNLGVLAALTPEDVDVVMYDDRMEPIPYRRRDRPGRHHGRDLHGAPLLRDRRRVSPARRAGGHGRLPADLRARRMRGARRLDLHRRRRDRLGAR